MTTRRIRLGVSSCLIGNLVRYDGKHKRDTYIAGTLGRHFDLVPVCPEVGIGMGVPRPPIWLVGAVDSPRAIGRDDTTIDVTRKLIAYGRETARRLDDLSGYLFKSGSPSCGLYDVPVYTSGRPQPARGLFALTFSERYPWLPVEDEQHLANPALRDNFFERVFAFRRWQEQVGDKPTVSALMVFHAAHKYALMAHRPRSASELGKMIATANKRRIRIIATEYLQQFMEALICDATPARHENVLAHIAGYLRGKITSKEMLTVHHGIERFRTGKLPRVAVLTALRRHFRHHPNPYIAQQTYLYPDPLERKLRPL